MIPDSQQSMIIPDTICRIQLSKISICLIKESYYLKLKVLLSSELSESINGLVFESPSSFEVSLLHLNESYPANKSIFQSSSAAWSILPTSFTFTNSTSSYYTLLAKLTTTPSTGKCKHSVISPGYYHIQIKSQPQFIINDKKLVLILPIITHPLFLAENVALTFPFITSNYRVVVNLFSSYSLSTLSASSLLLPAYSSRSDEDECQTDCLYISEQYGKTIGHHVYDCSFVLLQYIRYRFKNENLTTTVNCLDVIQESVDNDNSGTGGDDKDIKTLFTLNTQNPSTHSSPHCRHRRSNNDSNISSTTVCVELGAGLGVVGIGLSSYFDIIVLTDKISQMSILQENIQLNNTLPLSSLASHNHNSHQSDPQQQQQQQRDQESIRPSSSSSSAATSITAIPLDWSSDSDIDNFLLQLRRHSITIDQERPNNNKNNANNDNNNNDDSNTSLSSIPMTIDVIVASDVLYDADLAMLFFHTLRRLATPHVTQIYIAQKLRETITIETASVAVTVESSNSTSIDASTDAASNCTAAVDVNLQINDIINTTASSNTSTTPTTKKKTARFDVTTVPGFHCCLLHHAADCVIWGLTLL